MTDIDYCKGASCPQKHICQRYKDYLYRKEKNFDTKYAADYSQPCAMFKQSEYYGG